MFYGERRAVVAGLGGQLGTPDKKDAWLRNCLHQIGQWVRLWGILSIAN